MLQTTVYLWLLRSGVGRGLLAKLVMQMMVFLPLKPGLVWRFLPGDKGDNVSVIAKIKSDRETKTMSLKVSKIIESTKKGLNFSFQ